MGHAESVMASVDNAFLLGVPSYKRYAASYTCSAVISTRGSTSATGQSRSLLWSGNALERSSSAVASRPGPVATANS